MKIALTFDFDPAVAQEGYGISDDDWNTRNFLDTIVADGIEMVEGVTNVVFAVTE